MKYKAEIVDQKVWIKMGSQTWSYDLIDLASEGRRRQNSQSSSPEKITAQMPGKITKLFVKPGDQVIKGQPLLVMEAMKMEYTLKSDLNTIVKELSVELGQQVNLGQLLVQLEKEK